MESGTRWKPIHWVAASLAAVLLLVPLWRDREDCYFVIEPLHTRTLHAGLSGRVEAVMVQGGEKVHSGEPLLRMSSIAGAAMQSAATAETRNARFHAFNAQLRGQSIGDVAADQMAAEKFTRLSGEAQSKLEIDAPANGIILTQSPTLLLDQNVAYGQDLLDFADDGPRVARVYIPSSALDRIPANAEVGLVLPGEFSILRFPLAPPGGDAVTLPSGIMPTQKLKGIEVRTFYCSRIALPARKGNPMFGVSGEAKIFGERRSLAGRFLMAVSDLVRAHVW